MIIYFNCAIIKLTHKILNDLTPLAFFEILFNINNLLYKIIMGNLISCVTHQKAKYSFGGLISGFFIGCFCYSILVYKQHEKHIDDIAFKVMKYLDNQELMLSQINRNCDLIQTYVR